MKIKNQIMDLISSVVSDTTLLTLENLFSYDQKEHLSFKANATYGASFLCSPNNSSALGSKEINSSIGTILIFLSNKDNKISNSNSVNFDLVFTSSLCFLISVNNNSGPINSSFGESIKLVNFPATNAENTILASTTNNIYFPEFKASNLFLYSLYNDSLTFSPNFKASFSVNLDLATMALNKRYSLTFSAIAFRAISDQLSSGIDSISCFKSSGTAKVSVGILIPPLTFNTLNYVNYVWLYKSYDLGVAS